MDRFCMRMANESVTNITKQHFTCSLDEEIDCNSIQALSDFFWFEPLWTRCEGTAIPVWTLQMKLEFDFICIYNWFPKWNNHLFIIIHHLDVDRSHCTLSFLDWQGSDVSIICISYYIFHSNLNWRSFRECQACRWRLFVVSVSPPQLWLQGLHRG